MSTQTFLFKHFVVQNITNSNTTVWPKCSEQLKNAVSHHLRVALKT